ncbi:hypothetical protein [Blastococcus sp. KM273129]|uniref:argonaute/piwi family protein n=1 Tax=Blastococcus sp. KM273129 TaxID=2570315 RepID=UPI001F32FB27|nr:hypothetical protein [Blastococcus sp. KM273129]MCF6733687.1 hypothetical protein [Blastococcus sp. KM273129]
MRLTYLPEPDLEFFGGARHLDPRHGITDYGPADADQQHIRTIRVGVVGSEANIDGLRRWLDRCRQPLAAKDSRLTRFYLPFPGFDTTTGFRSTLVFDSRLERPIRERSLRRLTEQPPEVATRDAVDLYLDELTTLDEEPGCDVVLIARPDHLPERAAAPVDERRPWRKTQPTRPQDFRALLKAEAMRFSRPLQVIRRGTWDATFKDPDADGERRQQDEATRAWNLHTALYYKAGGVPWRLPRDPSALTSCYVGVSFYRTNDRATLHTSVAQVFNQRGDGVIIRGGPVQVSKDDRQPHLTAEDAQRLLSDSLKRYKAEHHTQPARVVLHKTSSYTRAEIDGFDAAADAADLAVLELLWLPSAEPIRLFRFGDHPPLRGTMLSVTAGRHLLYTRGSVPSYGTYPGTYIPGPLPFRTVETESSPEALASELLALTKMNWNQTQLDGKRPITLRTAEQVGEILRHIPEDVRPQPRYAYYM